MNLPNCICGESTWEPRGGHFGMGESTRAYCCSLCQAEANHFEGRGGNAFVVLRKEGSADLDKWLNGPAEATWATHAAEIRAEEVAYNRPFREEIVRKVGIDPNSSKMTDDRWELWRSLWKEVPEFKPTKRRAPELPRVPLGFFGYVQQGEEWEKVDVATSQLLSVPEHPARTATLAIFSALFASLSKELGCEVESAEIINQYSPSRSKIEPWFEVYIDSVTFVMGHRRQVYTLKWTCPGIAARLRPLAKRDQVTFSDDPGEGEIHAWTMDKLKEYVMACFPKRAPLAPSPSSPIPAALAAPAASSSTPNSPR